MARILVVEDDKMIQELIQRTLRMAGHTGLSAFTGREALRAVEEEMPDLVLLDLGLPDMDGLSVLKQIRKAREKRVPGYPGEQTELPVICVTARDRISDRVKGLTGGAEDYIIKPFAIEELVARIQVALRRIRKDKTLFHLKDLEVDLSQAKVWKCGRKVELTIREYELLRVLLEHQNMALSRSRLLDLAWGMDYEGDERTVDTHVRRLRSKLGLEEEIKTVFKYGYRLEME